MSEPKYREWILDTIDSLRSRKARPDLDRICRMIRRRHGSEPDRTCAELEKLIREQTVLKVNYKGSISYRNAAKVQRRSRKKDDVAAAATRRSGSAVVEEEEEASQYSDLSNGDGDNSSANGPTDQEEAEDLVGELEGSQDSDLSNGDSSSSAHGPTATDQDEEEAEDLEADSSMAMDTDSNAEEEEEEEEVEGGDESRDGQPSPVCDDEDTIAAAQCASSVHAFSAPCSPSSTRPVPRPGPSPSPSPGAGGSTPETPDRVPAWKAEGRAGSLPPSSPRALVHNDWAYDPAFCPAERQHPGMQRDKAVTPEPMRQQSVATSPCPLKGPLKREDVVRNGDAALSSDQLVPEDYGTPAEETRELSDGRPQTLPLPSDNCAKFKTKMDMASLMAEDCVLNGEVSVKKENSRQNLLQWSVSDVASYFSAAGFPEQAVAFRTQEIDGKSLLLMQRSDVLTGLSIRLGPALKIYERHVKVLQRTHFLEDEDL